MDDKLYVSEALASVQQRLVIAEAAGVSEYECMGRRFVVHEEVFPPTHFQSTGIFTQHLPYARGKSFLEIGCGAGVTAVTAALEGCYPVVASDISEPAVRNAQANAILHDVSDRMASRHGDLFDVLNDNERFDIIFWNSNFVFVPDNYTFEKNILRAFCDAGYLAHRRFLKEAPCHLNPGGMLLIGFSSQGADKALTMLLDEQGYSSKVLKSVLGEGIGAHRYDILQLLPGERTT
ncbi:MAG: class I SAM-dependent methyltransferase [Glaciimonas sp.]|nr:class I SAM-dependent methyltransferase [Glaciimonas sp.]